MSQSGGAQFTPGPWNAYNVHKGRILKHWQVDTGTGKVMLDDAAQWEAGNAALIAAAPAMYEALQQLVKVEQLRTQATLDNDYVDLVLADQQLQTLAQAALAQADGKQ